MSKSTIAVNRRARHEYHLEETFEAGVVLEGWEVKSLRAGNVQVAGGYVIVREGEAWLLGVIITPLPDATATSASDRTRKLLLSRREIAKLEGAVSRKGYTAVCVSLYWKRHLAKCEIALGKGKKLYDKRETERRRTLDREQEQALRDRRKR